MVYMQLLLVIKAIIHTAVYCCQDLSTFCLM